MAFWKQAKADVDVEPVEIDTQEQYDELPSLPTPLSSTVIATGVTMSGTLRGEGVIQVEGIVEGEIDLKGAVIVTPTGHIKGPVAADTVHIAGCIMGDVMARDHMRLEKTGSLEGDVTTVSLVVEDGGHLNGRSNMLKGEKAPGAPANNLKFGTNYTGEPPAESLKLIHREGVGQQMRCPSPSLTLSKRRPLHPSIEGRTALGAEFRALHGGGGAAHRTDAGRCGPAAAGAEPRPQGQGRTAGGAAGRGGLLPGPRAKVVDIQGVAQEDIALDEVKDLPGQPLLTDGADGRRQQQGREDDIPQGGGPQLVHPASRAQIHRQFVPVYAQAHLDGLIQAHEFLPALGLPGLDEIAGLGLADALRLQPLLRAQKILQGVGHILQRLTAVHAEYLCVRHMPSSVPPPLGR